jgi:twitching motility protein PilT
MENSENKKKLLEYAKSRNATDIHICAGSPVLFRVGGKLIPIRKDILTAEQSRSLSFELLSEKQKAKFKKDLDIDLMWADGEARYRINIGYFNGSVGATIRVLAGQPKTPAELFLPNTVEYLAHRKKGLVLITGSTSVGKTTTMASMIDAINRSSKKHIITIEDPIEYIHENKKGMVRQREVGRDTKTFASGLRAALRQDPDVIAIGEMRDFETIKIALTAAETGILVLSTLHVISLDKIIERLLSYAPEGGEGIFRFLLAESLEGVIHQELVPRIGGGQRVACEILVATPGAKNIIRRKGGYHLRTVIATGRKFGMCAMAESIQAMLDEGIITEDTAKSVMVNYSR